MRDGNGQPLIQFRRGANRERSLNTLLGICRGLISDRRLNDQEVSYLSTWLANNEDLIGSDSDVFDIADTVKDIIADGVITHDELEDLKEQLANVIEHRGGTRFQEVDAAMHYLAGFVHGVIADSHLRDAEIHALSDWLEQNTFLADIWPARQIFARVRAVLEDGVITEEERQHLVDVLTSLNGGSLEEIGTVGGVSTKLFTFEMPDEPVLFEGKSFLLTGKFVFGPRSKCEQIIQERGGVLSASVNRKTDYLVVGALSSRDWVNESYGRKIEAAMALRQEGCRILVVEEERWSLAL